MEKNVCFEFSNDGKYFSFINSQSKFVIYNVELNKVDQIYTPNLHLTAPCTCFVWLEILPNQKKRKSKNFDADNEKQFFIAFGTSKGGVALYSIATKQIERIFGGEGHAASVSQISTFNDWIFTCGNDGNIIKWSIPQSEQLEKFTIAVERLTCLSIVNEEAVLTGAKQLKLWNISKNQLTESFTGHTSNTIFLKSFNYNDENYAISASKLDRIMSLWLLESGNKSPVATFLLDDSVEYLYHKLIFSKLHILAISKSGVLHYFVQNVGKLKSLKPIKAKHTIEIASTAVTTKNVERIPILTATLNFSLNENEVLIGYGSEQNLKFERITIDSEEKNQILIRDNPLAIGTGNTKNIEQTSFKVKTPIVNENSVQYLNAATAPTSKKLSAKSVEIPMEERLENLSITKDGSINVSGKNLSHLLIQGIQSRNSKILRLVFGKNDEAIIKSTVKKLPSKYVGPLLTEISLLMQKRTPHVSSAITWLKYIIQIHSTHLMALGYQSFLLNIGGCMGIIEYRVEHLKSLSKLNGRLDLLLNQIERSQMPATELISDNFVEYQDESDIDSLIDENDEGDTSSDEQNYNNDDIDEEEEEEDNNDDDDDGKVDEEMEVSE
uniref:Small-subunit processome Utp12 domain-containing protein n=1 Tax=Corethrella appendiculata TaxID=1370023 RepID=U5ETI9_9DIPT